MGIPPIGGGEYMKRLPRQKNVPQDLIVKRFPSPCCFDKGTILVWFNKAVFWIVLFEIISIYYLGQYKVFNYLADNLKHDILY